MKKFCFVCGCEMNTVVRGGHGLGWWEEGECEKGCVQPSLWDQQLADRQYEDEARKKDEASGVADDYDYDQGDTLEDLQDYDRPWDEDFQDDPDSYEHPWEEWEQIIAERIKKGEASGNSLVTPPSVANEDGDIPF